MNARALVGFGGLERLAAVLPLVAVCLVVGAGSSTRPVYAVVLVALLVYATALLIAPRPTLLVYLAARPLADAFVYTKVGPVSLGQAWGAGLIASLIVFLALDTTTVHRAGRQLAPFAFLGLYAALTLWRPGAQFAALNEVKAVSWLLLIPVCERIAQTRQGQRELVRAALGMVVLLIVVMAHAYVTNEYGAAYYSTAVGGAGLDPTAQGPHALALLGVVLVPFVLLPQLAGRHRAPAWGLLALLSVGIFTSFVRSAFLGLVIVLGFYLLLALRRRSASAALAISGAIVALYGTYEALHSVVSERLANGAPRLVYWQAALGGTFSHISGILYGGGADASKQFISAQINERIWAHNDIVEFMTAGGVGLAVAYVALLAWMIRPAWSLAHDPRQSSPARDAGAVGVAAFAAYIAMGFVNGIAFAPASIAIGMLAGFMRGLTATPGATILDEAAA